MKDFFSKRSISIASQHVNTRSQHFLANQIGVTLLEALLAIAIASSITVLSLKAYYSMRRNADIQTLNANVDTLFVAMSQYYRANCGPIQWDSTGADVTNYYAGNGAVTTPGALYNNSISATPTSQAVSVTSLVNSGFLNTSNLTYTALVNNSGGPNTGYILQLNPSSKTIATFNTSVCTGTSVASETCTNSINNNTTTPSTAATSVMIWNTQVAVLLNVPSTSMNAYKNALGADCISSQNAGIVTPCNASPTPGNYLVWSRLASDPSPQTTDSLWSYMPYVKQFTLQYTHDQMYELSNNSGKYYYVCGG